MVFKMNQQILPFGKYKGEELVEVASKDPNYITWLKTQDWLKDDFKQQIINININGGLNAKQDSPEHNKLTLEIFSNLNKIIKGKITKLEYEYKEQNCWFDIYIESENDLPCRTQNAMVSILAKRAGKHHTEIEKLLKDKVSELCGLVSGEGAIYIVADDLGIRLDISDSHANWANYVNLSKCKIIEVKPFFGDDFMSYIRQIENYRSLRPNAVFYLIYEVFNVSNMTVDEVQSIFTSKDIKLINWRDLKNE